MRKEDGIITACLSVILLLVCLATSLRAQQDGAIFIASKKFTESVVLGELLSRSAQSAGAAVTHRRELGGTRVLWNALLRGEIDAYPEYSGTIRQEILAGENIATMEHMRAALHARGIAMSAPLGFNNTYALGMRAARAEQLSICTISDLLRHPDLRFGFSNEFMDRGDGWPGLRAHYNLPQQDVQGLDHDLAYRGLESGAIDVIDMYSTDAEIRYYDLRALADDLHFFPEYHALILYRVDLSERAPQAVRAMLQLEGRIGDSVMVALNARAKLERIPETQVAADFLRTTMGLVTAGQQDSFWRQFRRYTMEHLFLVGLSLCGAILLAIPLGILAYSLPRAGQIILGAVGVIQTIPSLALLVFMIPLLGIGAAPAVVALFLYSLLPIVRNTYAGLHDISPAVRESALALGLPPIKMLRLIELPLAARSILAGIKTSAVINIGTATLGALIGAGGYGQPILTGIRLDDMTLILSGAVPAALLALAAQGLFELLERLLLPRGLRKG